MGNSHRLLKQREQNRRPARAILSRNTEWTSTTQLSKRLRATRRLTGCQMQRTCAGVLELRRRNHTSSLLEWEEWSWVGGGAGHGMLLLTAQ